jgi:hypothetical protein
MSGQVNVINTYSSNKGMSRTRKDCLEMFGLRGTRGAHTEGAEAAGKKGMSNPEGPRVNKTCCRHSRVVVSGVLNETKPMNPRLVANLEHPSDTVKHSQKQSTLFGVKYKIIEAPGAGRSGPVQFA